MNKSILSSLLLIALIIVMPGCDNEVKSKINNQQNEVESNVKSDSIFSYGSIGKTLSQIKSLNYQLFQYEKLIIKEISTLKQSDSIFAEKEMFETTTEYNKRLVYGKAIIDSLRSMYSMDYYWHRISNLRTNLFETDKLSITLGEYNPDTEIYPITITHLDYKKEIIYTEIRIIPEKAKILFNNLEQVKIFGILAIDVENEINLSIIQVKFPPAEINYQFEIQPLFEINRIYDYRRDTFSPNGRFIAIQTGGSLVVLDLLCKTRTNYTIGKPGIDDICFSQNSKYIVLKKYSAHDYIVYDNFKKERIKDVNIKKRICYSKTGDYKFTIDKNREISADGKYQLVKPYYCDSYAVGIHRRYIHKEPGDIKINIVENNNITPLYFFEIDNNSNNSTSSSISVSEEYLKQQFLNSTVDEIDSRGTGLSIEEVEWLYQEAKKQGY